MAKTTLTAVYPIIWMDALVYKVRQYRRIEKRAIFCVIGIVEDGMKDLLGLYIAENEGAKFWLSILTVTISQEAMIGYDELVNNHEGFFVIHDPLQTISTVDIRNGIVQNSVYNNRHYLYTTEFKK